MHNTLFLKTRLTVCLFCFAQIIIAQTASLDYSDLNLWAAHPLKKDFADSVPKNSNLKDLQQSSEVDVFFIHPTTFVKKVDDSIWNANIEDTELNKKTDESTILNQASVFNAAGKIYAPRYRQAHIKAFTVPDEDTLKANAAFDLAYNDIADAFKYYLSHYNNGRPIIIASHSQGSKHAQRLLKDFFSNQTLKNKLVVAYVVGFATPNDLCFDIPACASPQQTGCICAWRTFRDNYEPTKFYPNEICVNPISFRTDTELATKELHEGAVLFGFKLTEPHTQSAQIYKNIVRTNKPHVFGNIFFNRKNYHIGDINLFYLNVRNDAVRRVGYFWKR